MAMPDAYASNTMTALNDNSAIQGIRRVNRVRPIAFEWFTISPRTTSPARVYFCPYIRQAVCRAAGSRKRRTLLSKAAWATSASAAWPPCIALTTCNTPLM